MCGVGWEQRCRDLTNWLIFTWTLSLSGPELDWSVMMLCTMKLAKERMRTQKTENMSKFLYQVNFKYFEVFSDQFFTISTLQHKDKNINFTIRGLSIQGLILAMLILSFKVHWYVSSSSGCWTRFLDFLNFQNFLTRKLINHNMEHTKCIF